MSTNIRFTKIKIPILSETRGNNTMRMVFECDLEVNLHAKDVELGLARIETPHKTKSPWGGLTVLDLLTTKAMVLLGRETASAGLSAVL